MTYQSVLKRLYATNLHRKAKCGLSNMHQLCAWLEFPERRFRSIHIAGTNGKGSVSTKIAKSLELSGLKTGIYTSPHISSFRERIRINESLISEETVIEIMEKLFALVDQHSIPATFFELTTALAFEYFARQQVDVAVIETGLGGRLDSTNVVSPCLTVITSIALDHTEILGKTIEDITLEKAGILKQNVPIILGPRVRSELITPIAIDQNSPITQIQGNFETFDKENSAIARRALEHLEEMKIFGVPLSLNILAGSQTRPPCRIESVYTGSQLCILDVAHNPDGLKHLFKSIRAEYPHSSLRIVCGLSKNKDVSNCVKILKEHGNAFHLIQAINPRALNVSELCEEFTLQKTNENCLHLSASIEEALNLAIAEAQQKNEVVVICGSFFLMPAVRKHLGIEEPCDPVGLETLHEYAFLK